MNKEELLTHMRALLESGQELKQQVVDQRHEQFDLPPCLWYVDREGESHLIGLMNHCSHEHEPPEILSSELVHAHHRFGPPVLLVLASEGYFDMAEEGEPLSVNGGRGSMERDFQDNPGSKITEAVLLTGCQDDLVGGTEMVQIVAPYSYDDGLRIRWHDQMTFQDDDKMAVGGAMADIMRLAFTTTDEEWTRIMKEGGLDE